MAAPTSTRPAPAPRPVDGAPPSTAAAAAAGKPRQPSRRNLFIAAGAAAAVVVVVAVALVLWGPWSDPVPRLNDDPVEVARFAAGGDVFDLPYDRQRLYMDLLNKKEDAIKQAYEQRLLSDDEYRKALQVVWYDKELGRMEKYFKQRSDSERVAYL